MQEEFLWFLYEAMAIAIVPSTISASPALARLPSLSLKARREKAMDTKMLSLSMGTTTLTTPFWMA